MRNREHKMKTLQPTACTLIPIIISTCILFIAATYAARET